MVSLKKKSHRQTTRLRAKIEKKVKEHKRKQKREAKKHPGRNKKKKDIGVPNSLPFKEVVLKEAAEKKRLQEEERAKQKERRKKDRQNLLDKNRSLDGMVKDAQKRGDAFDKKTQNKTDSLDALKGKNVETSLKTYYKEFRKVVDAADVILEVLDARDPIGSRCKQMEETVIGSGTSKRLVLVLNKIDLVPKENVEAWLKYLKNEYPVVAFKASTQAQHDNLGHKKFDFAQANEDLIKTSSCLGADTLMKLLANYCRNKNIKTVIRVGVVGLPNTGKSSIINSLKRSKACSVGSTPGITKQMQEVQLDKHIRLLDSPGVVMASGNSDTAVILRNCVKLESLEDTTGPVEAILRRCNKQQIMLHYCINEYKDVHEFLALLARRLGRLKKGGIPDVNRAARTVLQHWNMGKIKYYTHPPEQTSTHMSAAFVTEMGKEFDIDSLLADQKKIIDTLDQTSTTHMLVETMGAAKVVMQADEIDKVIMETSNSAAADSDDEDEDDAEMEDSGSDGNAEVEADDSGEEMEESDDDLIEDDDAEMKQMTVSLPAPGRKTRSSKNSQTPAVTPATVPTKAATSKVAKSKATMTKAAAKANKAEKMYAGLPQANKGKKMDFKKMKKQRRRREKVAGELSDALTSAFDLSGDAGASKGDDSYQFDDHFK